MDAFGLYQKYPVNRPLDQKELNDHLPQNVQSSKMPWHGLGVIKMNSTFLEFVDKFYPEKGHGPLVFALSIFMLSLVLPSFIEMWPKTPPADRWLDIVAIPIIFSIPGMGFWVFQREIRYTHTPIRFNRKTRKVYVFRRNGTVMTEDWDKLYFTLGKHWITEVEIRCHRMTEDRRTWRTWTCFREDCQGVLETFALPWSLPRSSPYLTMQWEFIRRYMESPEELDDLAKQVDVVMPVADRREGFMHGFMRHFALAGGGVGSVILTPYFFVLSIGRWIVMHVARMPKWPKEVEDACQIEADDPWQLDAPPRGAEPTPVWNHATHAPHDGKRPDYVC